MSNRLRPPAPAPRPLAAETSEAPPTKRIYVVGALLILLSLSILLSIFSVWVIMRKH